MTGLAPGVAVDAHALPLAPEPLPESEVRAGAPAAAATPLADIAGAEVGVWEMTPGTAVDTETDEVFVVLSGRASIAFEAPALPTVEVGPGSVMRLSAGMRTVWTVTETLRKVYIA